MDKLPVMYDFEVSHPDYGTVTVSSIGPDSATIAATERWGCREDWGKIAGYCQVRKFGKTQQPRCRKCGKEIPAAGLCTDCKSAEDQFRRQMAGMKSRDHRAGYRGNAQKNAK